MGLTFFLSDIHLETRPNDNGKEYLVSFLNFLQSLEKSAERIFLIGDIFDFWFEYKYAIPKNYFSVLHQLAKLRDRNIEIIYLAGNHDFHLGSFFENELGIKTFSNEWTGEISGKKFYIYHGDGIYKKDYGYRILKKILRNPTNIKLYRLLHPDLGIPLARFISGSSRRHSNKSKNHNDYIEFARERFKEGYDYVVMGHIHKPTSFEESGKKYINIGDWIENFTYGVFDNNDLTLQSI